LRNWFSTEIPPAGKKNQSVTLMGNSMKKNLTILQSGVNLMGRFSLDGVESSRWAAWKGGKSEVINSNQCSY